MQILKDPPPDDREYAIIDGNNNAWEVLLAEALANRKKVKVTEMFSHEAALLSDRNLNYSLFMVSVESYASQIVGGVSTQCWCVYFAPA